jgi:hypothetical protein
MGEPLLIPLGHARHVRVFAEPDVGERYSVLLAITRPAAHRQSKTETAVVNDLEHGHGLADHRGRHGKLDAVEK